MGLTPLLPFTFQGYALITVVVDPDPELFPGIHAILIFKEAASLVVVKINAAYQVFAVLGSGTYTFNGVLPVLTTAGNYNLIYEHDGENWYVGIIAKGSI